MDSRRLSAGERRRLAALVRRTRDKRQYQRGLAVLESDTGRSAAQIAQALHVSRQSVYNWTDEFCRTRDVQALADAPRSGRPRGWNRQTEVFLRALLRRTPQRLGYLATQWTVPLLQEQLRHSTGQCHCARTIRRGLHRLGYVWKRARYVLIPDPQREKKTPDLPRRQWLAGAQRVAGRG